MEEGGWWIGYLGGRGVEEGVWSGIKYEIEKMERVEHNTTIEHNVMNEYGIE